MATHPDSDQLALLALKADVDDSVREHLATCQQCQHDLSLLESLLAADGPDGDSGGSVETVAGDELTAAESAWADGRDASAAEAESVTFPEAQEPNSDAGQVSRSAVNPTALVAVIVIVLVSIGLAVFALR